MRLNFKFQIKFLENLLLGNVKNRDICLESVWARKHFSKEKRVEEKVHGQDLGLI